MGANVPLLRGGHLPRSALDDRFRFVFRMKGERETFSVGRWMSTGEIKAVTVQVPGANLLDKWRRIV
jgi:hypothetical protein